MNHIILTCNAGSTNSKFAAYDSKTLEKRSYAVTHGIAEAVEWLCSIGSLGIAAIGHRVVHGGQEFTEPVRLTNQVIEKLHTFVPLAPLHQPAALRLMEETLQFYPCIPQIACFDTAFHHTMPEIERRLPLPRWYHNHGIRRYGFHGLSYRHIANVLPKYTERYAKVIAVHLGGGASACAMHNLESVASTMGFSTLDGLMMATRSGAIDSGVVIYLEKELEMRPQEVERLLYLESGLLGVSGVSADMRTVLASDKPEAKEAVELYCLQAAKQIAGLLPALCGLDSLVFTGGIGENNPAICERITKYLRWIGDFAVYVIPTDEELVIAESCRSFISGQL